MKGDTIRHFTSKNEKRDKSAKKKKQAFKGSEKSNYERGHNKIFHFQTQERRPVFKEETTNNGKDVKSLNMKENTIKHFTSKHEKEDKSSKKKQPRVQRK
ncbi:hypothetical protein JTE90_023930 [Oedothorax gibbosus]|uniref:Uncharacterized protein n=1 Tax=Oedothorax gibbosus TaxID=931172 RepID=A0AAV6UTY3_9ARAC|nr:hypothetical protein JTE90_023930 [Oedothorax gibbosus]